LTSSTSTELSTYADYWRKEIGVNVIPANTKKKETYESWKEWQYKPIPQKLQSEWKESGAFNNGIAIILGKVWHNLHKTGLFLVRIDLDNQRAIEEICNRNGNTISLLQLSRWTLVEQHLDLQRLTFYYILESHFQKRVVTIIPFQTKLTAMRFLQ
jgi:hypothetical protein